MKRIPPEVMVASLLFLGTVSICYPWGLSRAAEVITLILGWLAYYGAAVIVRRR